MDSPQLFSQLASYSTQHNLQGSWSVSLGDNPHPVRGQLTTADGRTLWKGASSQLVTLLESAAQAMDVPLIPTGEALGAQLPELVIACQEHSAPLRIACLWNHDTPVYRCSIEMELDHPASLPHKEDPVNDAVLDHILRDLAAAPTPTSTTPELVTFLQAASSVIKGTYPLAGLATVDLSL